MKPNVPATFPGGKRRLPLRRRLLFVGVWFAWIVFLAWGGERVFWRIACDLPVTALDPAATVWAYYYPELIRSGAATADPRPDDGRLDVLLLGGSVLQQVAEELEAVLRERAGQPVRVYSLCAAAHTSRDSLLKFRRLGDGPFDVVVIYHGINDARMNCCPQDRFRDDYTHCLWYRGIERALAASSLSAVQFLEEGVAGRLIPRGQPLPEFAEYGGVVKTAPVFRRNLDEILRTCGARGVPVVLMTFASHLPAGYTAGAFTSGELDYGRGPYRMRAEVWGRPDHVVRAIELHNAGIRQLVALHRHVRFVDQARLLPRDGRHFSDICHLTRLGRRQFTENLWPSILGAPVPAIR